MNSPAPDYYGDDSYAICYRWIPGRGRHSMEVRQAVVTELAAGLQVHAELSGTRLSGHMHLDLPNPRSLPPEIQREVRRTLALQQPRIWRRLGMVLVRAWQSTTPAQ